ncbi:hypothetical protein C8R44DRAFT_950326 [Mycena epipterygia]|nr:hypothetical protein C8R44DRAFT_950326 [Mycena epipterygia]
MDRLRKFSKVFKKDFPVKPTETYVETKPIYRGTKPLTVSDIHSHSPIDMKRSDPSCDELGTKSTRCPPCLPDLIGQFPSPPPFRPVLTDAHLGGPRLYFPNDGFSLSEDDLLPPPPDKVLDMIKQRERTHTHEARLEQQRTPKVPVDIPPYRRPLYANSHSNVSTRSLGANVRLKTGPIAQRAVVQQAPVHNSVPQKVHPITLVPAPPPRPVGQRKNVYTMPEGERKRLRSVPTQLSPTQFSAANEELYRAYPSTVQGRPKRRA